MCITVFFLLACSAGTSMSLRTSSGGSVALDSRPRNYKHDCGKKVRVAASLAQIETAGVKKLPGAGISPGAIEPYAEVLKDGFWPVECVKDYLLEHGDKFGGNSANYKLGQRANVSIVRYLEHIPKEDQEPMTHEVCFLFCRSVPHMSFFGLAHGRDCYCEPYYEAMAGDSSECDAVCEGETTTMCGGMKKSSIFQMHTCGDTAEEIKELAGALGDMSKSLDATVEEGDKVATELQDAASDLQAKFGQAGDPAASNLMQGAKGTASDLRAAVKAAKGEAEALADLLGKAEELSGADLEDPDKMAEAEAALVDGKTAMDAAGEAGGALEKLVEKVQGPEGGSLKPYVTITYLVDKEFESAPSTCGGTPLGVPLAGATAEACAAACDTDVQNCNGFSYFGGKVPVCILLSKLTSTTYYTKCEASEFLQSGEQQPTPPAPKKEEGPTPPAPKEPEPAPTTPGDTKCYAKFQNFEGVSLKPDPSGKCELCLKSATKAERCF